MLQCFLRCWMYPVILFVRMWVEMFNGVLFNSSAKSSSSWGCELKCSAYTEQWLCCVSSSSSWGCELKWCTAPFHDSFRGHPLREDVSWNNLCLTPHLCQYSHPLREDVSWNIERCGGFPVECGHPLREDVSWNDSVSLQTALLSSHPLREDVSWNRESWSDIIMASSHPLREDVSWNVSRRSVKTTSAVILFVRMWVEMNNGPEPLPPPASSSSWGCELKC